MIADMSFWKAGRMRTSAPGTSRCRIEIALQALVLTAGLVSVTGCGTLLRSTEAGAPGELYPAVNVDVQGWRWAARPDPWGGSGPSAVGVCLARFLCLIDLPISLVTDTVLLPVDLALKEPSILIQVRDTLDRPVPDVSVRTGAMNGRERTGLTKADGTFRFGGNCQLIEYVNLRRDGYYDSQQRFQHGGIRAAELVTGSYGMLLKEKTNPVPMYAKRARFELPAATGSFGYDLVAGDLVAPHGVGKTADLVFHVQPGAREGSLDLDVTFPGVGDGIQPFFVQHLYYALENQLRSPYAAPTIGYFASLKTADGDWQEKYRGSRSAERSWSGEVNYFLRVRSGVAGQGWYGKIYGAIQAHPRGKDIPCVQFDYYLNPDGTTNIEYDPKRPLLRESDVRRYKLHEYLPDRP